MRHGLEGHAGVPKEQLDVWGPGNQNSQMLLILMTSSWFPDTLQQSLQKRPHLEEFPQPRIGLKKNQKKQWLWKHNNWNLQAFILNWSQPRNVPPWSHHPIPMGKRGLVAQNGYHVRGRKFLIDVLQRFVKVVLWIAWLSRRPRAAVCHAFYLSLSGHPWIAGLRSAR